MTSPLPELVTQAQWAAHLGVSTGTFLRWRRHGVRTMRSGVIDIPAPVDLPGWPRWKREDVLRVSRLLINGKRRLFARAERPLQSHASRFQQSSRSLHGAGVSGELISEVHGESVGDGANAEQSNSLAGVR